MRLKWDRLPHYFVASMSGLHALAECILLGIYANREYDVQGNCASFLVVATCLHIICGFLLAADLFNLLPATTMRYRYRSITTVIFGIHVTLSAIAFTLHPSYLTNTLLMTWIWVWWTIYLVAASFVFLYFCWWLVCYIPLQTDACNEVSTTPQLSSPPLPSLPHPIAPPPSSASSVSLCSSSSSSSSSLQKGEQKRAEATTATSTPILQLRDTSPLQKLRSPIGKGTPPHLMFATPPTTPSNGRASAKMLIPTTTTSPVPPPSITTPSPVPPSSANATSPIPPTPGVSPTSSNDGKNPLIPASVIVTVSP